MNAETEQVTENTKKIFFVFFPICIFFYLILSRHFPRNGYQLIKPETLNSKIGIINEKFESRNKFKIRKKLTADLKIHNTHLNFKKKQITKLLVNNEGKIIGYKFCSVFYPTYFTKIQNKNLIRDGKLVKNPTSFFLIVINYN